MLFRVSCCLSERDLMSAMPESPDASGFEGQAVAGLLALLPEAAREVFHLSTNGYPRGMLSNDSTYFAFDRTRDAFIELRTTDRRAFAALVHALPGSRLLEIARPAIDTSGWVWCDTQFDGLQGAVRMAGQSFTLHLSARGVTSAERAWRDIDGAAVLDAFPVGEDPRIVVPGHDWLRYVAQHAGKTSLEFGSSCEYRPTGLLFEVHDRAFADFVAFAYGDLFGLPACEVIRSETGPRKERLYTLDIRIPGAAPMMGEGAKATRKATRARAA